MAPRRDRGRPVRRLLVATDFSEACREMTSRSIRIARDLDACIDLVYVRDVFGDSILEGGSPTSDGAVSTAGWIDRSLTETAQIISDAGITCFTSSLVGVPARRIVDHARKTGVDMIILGGHGHGGVLHSVFGNIARRVTRKASCPVLVLPTSSSAGWPQAP